MPTTTTMTELAKVDAELQRVREQMQKSPSFVDVQKSVAFPSFFSISWSKSFLGKQPLFTDRSASTKNMSKILEEFRQKLAEILLPFTSIRME